MTNHPVPEAPPVTTTPVGRKTVAAFDFDGTLTSGGSVLPFLVAVRGFWPVCRAVVALAPKLLRSALMGGTAADAAKEKLFTRLLGGLPVQLVDERSVTFAQRHLARHLRQDAQLRLRWHQRQGHHVVIVSASPECYVRQAGQQLGVDGVLATRLAVGGGGLLTGNYEGKNCRGAEKYARLVVHLVATTSPSCGPMATVGAICASCAPPTMASTPGCWAHWDACGSSPGWPRWSGSPRRAVRPD
jgi:phosphatidylglycerophosphatase C